MINDILRTIDRSQDVVSVLLDLSAAFDVIARHNLNSLFYADDTQLLLLLLLSLLFFNASTLYCKHYKVLQNNTLNKQINK